MTDEEIADKVYIEPLTVESVSRIIERERPDGLLPTLGGQTGLNLAVDLADSASWKNSMSVSSARLSMQFGRPRTGSCSNGCCCRSASLCRHRNRHHRGGCEKSCWKALVCR